MRDAGDVWSVGKLDLAAYLGRVQYAGPAEPSAATLTALYRAHLASIRFENLDIFLRHGVSADLEDIQEKIVFRGRGGYCYEQAQLFGAALERLGFGVERLLARVGPDGGPVRPRTHLTLRVRADQNVWLADVGFGSAPPAPLSLRRYRSGGPQEVDGWIYEIAPDEEPGTQASSLFPPSALKNLPSGTSRQASSVWKLREYRGGSWVTLHRWDDVKVQPADVVLSNYYTATHPDSWFTWQPVIVKRDPDAIRSVVGRTYTVNRPGQERERRELTDREFAEALAGEFALRLTDDEMAAVVAAPAGRDRQPAADAVPGT
ncbi:MAG TPA: arylamine N-acetyltransferase [Trebonia sp.]|nr:arylamine N-acetyltransferase [Trebonia sp.]